MFFHQKIDVLSVYIVCSLFFEKKRAQMFFKWFLKVIQSVAFPPIVYTPLGLSNFIFEKERAGSNGVSDALERSGVSCQGW
jgi:hypothetical protein